MEILTDFSPLHHRYGHVDRISDSLTFAPIAHHLSSYDGRVNLIVLPDDSILVEQACPSTIALSVVHAGVDLLDGIAAYVRTLERDAAAELLPADALAQQHRSLLYLPPGLTPPGPYSMSHKFAKVTAFGAALPTESVEWARTFALSADGTLATDSSITVERVRPAIHPGLDRILTRLFPPA